MAQHKGDLVDSFYHFLWLPLDGDHITLHGVYFDYLTQHAQRNGGASVQTN
jgi:hypothetical protein